MNSSPPISRLVVTEDSAPFWKACRERYLALPKCEDCGQFHLPPGPVCPFCLSAEIAWVKASGRGRLSSWTIYHKAFSRSFRGRTPYLTALVELDEGPRLMTTLRGVPYTELTAGLRVSVEFEETEGDLALPVFHSVEETSDD